MIRVISGDFKGRKLATPDGHAVRPTTDRMRERVFSILNHHRFPDLAGARVADFFAGTGALGLEALSRGAAHVTFIEQDPAALSCLISNIDMLGVDKQVSLLTRDATACGLCETPFDFIFMDAPYDRGLTDKALAALAAGQWLAADGVVIAEVHKGEKIELPDGYDCVDTRTQGIQKTLYISQTAIL